VDNLLIIITLEGTTGVGGERTSSTGVSPVSTGGADGKLNEERVVEKEERVVEMNEEDSRRSEEDSVEIEMKEAGFKKGDAVENEDCVEDREVKPCRVSDIGVVTVWKGDEIVSFKEGQETGDEVEITSGNHEC